MYIYIYRRIVIIANKCCYKDKVYYYFEATLKLEKNEEKIYV